MRIIAGTLKGRRIVSPKGHTTRPTTDRVRESVFSVLTSVMGEDLDDAVVLDAFAGSGALGIEALSRGARSCVFVELDRQARRALTDNIASLGLAQRASVLPVDVFAQARRGIISDAGQPFSLILLDPPYTIDPARTGRLLADLSSANAIEPGCVVVWEHASNVEPEWPAGFSELSRRRYGSTHVAFARAVEGKAV